MELKQTESTVTEPIIVKNTIYDCSIVFLKGKQFYQTKILIGKYSSGRPKFKRITAKTKEMLIEKIKNTTSFDVNNKQNETIETLCRSWLNFKFNNIAPATYDKIESVVNTHIIPDIGKDQIKKLSDLQYTSKYILYLASNGNIKLKSKKGLSYNTILKIKSILSEITDYAISSRLLDINAFKSVHIPKTVSRNTEKKILTNEELKRFLNELNRVDKKGNYVHYYRNVILFMMNTGMRACEVFALKKDMVNLELGLVYVERNRIRVRDRNLDGSSNEGYVTVICDETKNQSSRRKIPLNETALKIIKEQFNIINDDIVFPNANGQIVKPTTFAQKFNNICEKANVKITPHSLRHLFTCAMCENSGLTINEIAKILGHSSISVTYNTYMHQRDDAQLEMKQKMNNIYNI